jgi:phosphate transport system ATP-binding protein
MSETNPSEAITPSRSAQGVVMETRNLCVTAKTRSILRNLNLSITARSALGIVGPSGAGKSTLLKSFNRLLELTPDIQFTGDILFHGQSIFSSAVDVDELRTRVGMIFQQPVVFPRSISENVLFGAVRRRRLSKTERADLTEKALREAALWSELKDRLNESASRISVGQQQRLCLARALALDPEVILLDEPTSALDGKATSAIEDLILTLKQSRAIVLVSHDQRQIEKVCDSVYAVVPETEAP